MSDSLLSANSEAPDFTAKASLNGQEYELSLNESLSNGPVVLYFYPSAYTKGCDIEARTFTEQIEKFNEAGATIVGTSADSIERLNQFSADPDFCAGNFPVISDPDGQIASEYGLEVTSFPDDFTDENGDSVEHALFPRVTFAINPNGHIETVLSSERDDVTPAEHVTKSLEVIQNL